MKKNLYERVGKFFKRFERSRVLREEIKGCDRVIQFDLNDGDPFYVQIKQGKVDFGKRKRYPPDVKGGLYIIGDRQSLESLFEGRLSLAESIYHHKIRIPGYRTKEPVMVWFSKLLRKGRGEK